jgi:hypothetical protein
MIIDISKCKDKSKYEFLIEIKNHIDGLELQRSRIYASSDISAVHDAGYYMILLRRIYREIEKMAEHDSRVANLKGKYRNLYPKIKIRDDFEHTVKKMAQIDRKTLIELGITCKESSGNIFIQTSVCKNADSILIISGDNLWDMSCDHQAFLNMVAEYVKLYPFKLTYELKLNNGTRGLEEPKEVIA